MNVGQDDADDSHQMFSFVKIIDGGRAGVIRRNADYGQKYIMLLAWILPEVTNAPWQEN
jgi:hypothetical protein